MRGLPQESLHAITKRASHYPAVDTAAVVTLAAIPEERHVIKQIDVSYRGGVPVAAGIVVTIGGTTVYELDLPLAQDCYQLYFPDGLFDADADSLNQVVVVTATDPGEAATRIKLTVFYK